MKKFILALVMVSLFLLSACSTTNTGTQTSAETTAGNTINQDETTANETTNSPITEITTTQAETETSEPVTTAESTVETEQVDSNIVYTEFKNLNVSPTSTWDVSVGRSSMGIYIQASTVNQTSGDKLFLLIDTAGKDTRTSTFFMIRLTGGFAQIQSYNDDGSKIAYTYLIGYNGVTDDCQTNGAECSWSVFIPWSFFAEYKNNALSISENDVLYMTVYGANGSNEYNVEYNGYTPDFHYSNTFLIWNPGEVASVPIK